MPAVPGTRESEMPCCCFSARHEVPGAAGGGDSSVSLGLLETVSASKNEEDVGKKISCSAGGKTKAPTSRRMVSVWNRVLGTMWACRMVEDAANGFRKVVASRARFPRQVRAGVMPPLHAAIRVRIPLGPPFCARRVSRLVFQLTRGGAVWQRVGLIPQRPEVRILPPLPILVR